MFSFQVSKEWSKAQVAGSFLETYPEEVEHGLLKGVKETEGERGGEHASVCVCVCTEEV